MKNVFFIANERLSDNVSNRKTRQKCKDKKVRQQSTYERSTYSTSPHTYTGWAGCFFKSVGNKKLAFPLLLSNPSPIFRSYFPDQVCKRPWNFERVPNSIIQGHDRALIFTSTKEACLAACLNEVLFFIIDFEVSSTLWKKSSAAANCRDSLFFPKRLLLGSLTYCISTVTGPHLESILQNAKKRSLR